MDSVAHVDVMSVVAWITRVENAQKGMASRKPVASAVPREKVKRSAVQSRGTRRTPF